MFIIPPQKSAKKVDIQSALLGAVKSSKGNQAASKAKASCQHFQKLRSAVHEPPTTAQANLGLRRYLCAIEHAQTHIPNTDNLAVTLLWCDAFDVETTTERSDLALDRAATAFNLGVCEAKLGVEAYKTSVQGGYKTALDHFRNAASYFKLVMELPKVSAQTIDLNNNVLQALTYAMLGNAQQMFFKHYSKAGSVKASLLALFAAGASDFYGHAAEMCAMSGVSNVYLDKVVRKPAAALRAALNSQAQLLHGIGFQDVMDLGHAIPQYAIAARVTEEALKVAEELETVDKYMWLQFLKEDLVADLRQRLKKVQDLKLEAEKLNRTIYLCALAGDVPRLQPKKSITVRDMSEAIGSELDHVSRLLGGFE